MEIQRFRGSAPWEKLNGYCRVVRAGQHVFVSGTTATNDKGEIAGQGDAGEQTRQAFANIQKALEGVGASLADTVRTRMYVVDIEKWGESVGRVHYELFGACNPVSTMVGVAALYTREMLVECEVDAFIVYK